MLGIALLVKKAKMATKKTPLEARRDLVSQIALDRGWLPKLGTRRSTSLKACRIKIRTKAKEAGIILKHLKTALMPFKT